MWEDESRRRAAEVASAEVLDSYDVPQPTHISTTGEPVAVANSSSETPPSANVSSPEKRAADPVSVNESANGSVPTVGLAESSISHVQSSVQQEQVTSHTSTQDSPSASIVAAHLVGEPPVEHSSQGAPSPQVNASPSSEAPSATSHTSTSTSVTHSSSSVSHASIPASSVVSTSASSSPANVSVSSNASTQSHTAQSSRSISTSSTSDTPVPTIHSLTVVPPNTGGESIYRIIMNRLTAVEGNTTLYARYVEEQIASVREMMRRIGEDVGRLEGIVSLLTQLWVELVG